jgi:hypothetical protein
MEAFGSGEEAGVFTAGAGGLCKWLKVETSERRKSILEKN